MFVDTVVGDAVTLAVLAGKLVVDCNLAVACDSLGEGRGTAHELTASARAV